MALSDGYTIGDSVKREDMLAFVRKGMAASNPNLSGPDDPRIFGAATALADSLMLQAKKLPGWALESIDQCLKGVRPDNLAAQGDVSKSDFTTRPIEYLTDVIDGVAKGAVTAADRNRADDFYFEKHPEQLEEAMSREADRKLADKIGVKPLSDKEKAEVEKNKAKLQKEAEKRAAKYEKSIQKLDAKENREIRKWQKQREKMLGKRGDLRSECMEKNAEGRLQRKPGISDKKWAAYQKSETRLKAVTGKLDEATVRAEKRLAEQYKAGKVSEHYYTYRGSQLETGDLSYRISQSFQTQEWSKSMLERYGFDKLDKADQRVKIEEMRQKAAAQIAQREAEKKQEPARKKVPPEDIGLAKKEAAKSKDVTKDAPAATRTKTK